MDITIYSESPHEGDIQKAANLDFPVNILVSAKNLGEFRNLQKQYLESSKNIKKVGYWLSLTKKQGCWISPFTDKSALESLFIEIEQDRSKKPLQIMLDLEPPLLANGIQMFKGIPGYWRKKARIKQFVENANEKNIEVVTAEYPSILGTKFLQRFAGIAYDPNKIAHLKVPMFYTSFVKSIVRSRALTKALLRREARNGKKKYGDNFGIGLGCIARSGIALNPKKKLLSADQLKEDLQIIQDEGIKKTFIYSCKGLDLNTLYGRECHDVLKEFAE